MRTAVACFVLAALIATPGLVVAAMSSGGHGTALIGYSSGTVEAIPAQPIDARLRPTVQAVRTALGARAQLQVLPAGTGAAELVQLPGPGIRCPISIVFQLNRQSKEILFSSSCGTGTIQAGRTTITYAPSSIRPTIERAVAGLR